MKQFNKSRNKYFLQFLQDFWLHGITEYERLTPKEKQITDRAFLKDLPNLIKKSQLKKS